MKKFLLGCGGLLVVAAILVGLLILETPRFLEAGKKVVGDLMAEEARIGELETAWQPPALPIDDRWFPATIGEWKLERAELSKDVPAIGLKRPGVGATYRSSRGVMEVNVVSATESERAALLTTAQETLAQRHDVVVGSRSPGVQMSFNRQAARLTTTRGNRTYIRIGSADNTRLWFLKGHLFIFRAAGAADSDTFPEEFLRAVSTPAAP